MDNHLKHAADVPHLQLQGTFDVPHHQPLQAAGRLNHQLQQAIFKPSFNFGSGQGDNDVPPDQLQQAEGRVHHQFQQAAGRLHLQLQQAEDVLHLQLPYPLCGGDLGDHEGGEGEEEKWLRK